ncbi:MAG: hypothetical protein NCW75_03720 [Phycisphaera sp.]|nr:MAG: hypothetical protein NCW75_03720 [Phycisphaera sp.]
MSLFQRFMRVLTHPQHAGEPMTQKKAKAPRAPKPAKPIAPAMKVAGKPKAPSTGTAMRPVSHASSSVAVADQPKVPGTPARPIEVFAPNRPGQDEPDGALGSGSLLEDMDDSTLGLVHPEPKADKPPKTTAIEAAPEPELPTGPEIGEVVDLIEKLRTHVDAQGGRFDQAMGVLDQIRESAAALPEIRERIDTMLASIDELKANQFKGHEKVERALATQSARLDEISQAIAHATQREEKLAQSLLEINQTILAVSGTNDRLASAIDAMRRHEAERDARIGRALTGAQRWLVVLTLVMVVGMVATIITAIAMGN